eukprot:c18257_g1_i2.p1 GENE.c18257_g1_i2~~c18257_g1_i2.p1  ORF type:complete len:333 (-),score=79.00 c18257_g1_i2:122-1120(-)
MATKDAKERRRSSVKSQSYFKFTDISEKYTIGDVLGSGHYAEVRLGINKETGEKVAIKVCARGKMEIDDIIQEIDILARVEDHPHVIQLKEIYEKKGRIFIVMELVTGGELFDRIVEVQYYKEPEARNLMRCLIETIGHMHSHGIVHRDLKPENAIFQTPDEDSILKVSDFGFANVYDPNNQFVATCGTPLYVAPEILDCVPYNYQCDMWSLGVIVFILLCGYPPFYGEDDQELFDQIRHARYQFLSPAWDRVSSDAKDFISQCFQLSPKARLTAENALKHKWITELGAGSDHLHLGDTLYELKRTQCKRKFIKAIDAVIAINRLERSAGAL